MNLRIEPSSGVPITRQIMDQLRTQCVSGHRQPGDRLPSVREFARELAVNQNTILRVYERLTAEGFLQRRHGDGTYVADRLPKGQLKSQETALRDELGRIVRRARVLGVEPADLHALLDDALRSIPPTDGTLNATTGTTEPAAPRRGGVRTQKTSADSSENTR